MVHSKEKVQCFFRLPKDLVRDFDRKIARMGYASRAEIFTAVAYVFMNLSDEKADSLSFKIAAELRKGDGNHPPLSERQIRQKLREIIDSLFKPIVACKGVNLAFQVGADDVLSAFHEETGIWLTEDEIREGFYQYDLLNKNELRDYALSIKHQKEGDNI